jgi:fibronectin-binding autotransporter adhesin
MRTKNSIRISWLGFVAGLLLALPVFATSYTWDANPGTAGVQWGSGNWDTITNTWHDGSGNLIWPNSLSDTAVFSNSGQGGANETITVASGIQAGGITFAMTPNWYTVVVSGGDITLADGTTIIPGTSTTGGFPELNSVVHGGAINIGNGGAAVGRVVLGGANDYTGVTTIKSNSLLNIRHANALGATGAGTVVENGGCLVLGGAAVGGFTTAAEPLTLNGTGVNNGGALTTFNTGGTYAGPITLGSAARINSVSGNGYLTLSGGITGANVDLLLGGTAAININNTIDTGSGKVTIDGGSDTYGTWLNTANLFTGGVVLNGGYRVYVTHPTALGPADKATVTFGPGSTKELWLQKNPGMNVTIVGLNTDPTNPGSPIVRQTSSGSYGGSTLIVSNATANTFAGTLMDGVYKFTLIKANVGTLTLSGTNTYTGATTINGGMLVAGNTNALGTAGTVTVNTNGTLGVAAGVTFSRAVAFNAGGGLGGSGTFATNGVWTLPANFTLKPGLSTNAVGTLTVDTGGNTLTATNGTRLEIDFDGAAGSDQLVVNGPLNLGTANDTLVLKGAIKGRSYVIASASSLSGRFVTVDKSGLDTPNATVMYPGDGTVVVFGPGGTSIIVQ